MKLNLNTSYLFIFQMLVSKIIASSLMVAITSTAAALNTTPPSNDLNIECKKALVHLVQEKFQSKGQVCVSKKQGQKESLHLIVKNGKSYNLGKFSPELSSEQKLFLKNLKPYHPILSGYADGVSISDETRQIILQTIQQEQYQAIRTKCASFENSNSNTRQSDLPTNLLINCYLAGLRAAQMGSELYEQNFSLQNIDPSPSLFQSDDRTAKECPERRVTTLEYRIQEAKLEQKLNAWTIKPPFNFADKKGREIMQAAAQLHLIEALNLTPKILSGPGRTIRTFCSKSRIEQALAKIYQQESSIPNSCQSPSQSSYLRFSCLRLIEMLKLMTSLPEVRSSSLYTQVVKGQGLESILTEAKNTSNPLQAVWKSFSETLIDPRPRLSNQEALVGRHIQIGQQFIAPKSFFGIPWETLGKQNFSFDSDRRRINVQRNYDWRLEWPASGKSNLKWKNKDRSPITLDTYGTELSFYNIKKLLTQIRGSQAKSQSNQASGGVKQKWQALTKLYLLVQKAIEGGSGRQEDQDQEKQGQENKWSQSLTLKTRFIPALFDDPNLDQQNPNSPYSSTDTTASSYLQPTNLWSCLPYEKAIPLLGSHLAPNSPSPWVSICQANRDIQKIELDFSLNHSDHRHSHLSCEQCHSGVGIENPNGKSTPKLSYFSRDITFENVDGGISLRNPKFKSRLSFGTTQNPRVFVFTGGSCQKARSEYLKDPVRFISTTQSYDLFSRYQSLLELTELAGKGCQNICLFVPPVTHACTIQPNGGQESKIAIQTETKTVPPYCVALAKVLGTHKFKSFDDYPKLLAPTIQRFRNKTIPQCPENIVPSEKSCTQ